ncbi:glycosyltransferase family 2 protein [Hymenobacter pini]|uniref:glycosyltransferase family 2 protein n=1 Tax=Hymenobacter pini TaxID=2880879 RepID=UPI001CF2B64F|nr:glycosyltransferase family 2 protein [Hymenobacter pini]MCA8832686.1 glycosyltransferase family 2 protein [Hymenobacter pini]
MPFSHPAPSSTLAIVLPCYRPPDDWAANILTSLQRLQGLLPAHVVVHLYVVNDGAEAAVTEADIQLLQNALTDRFTYLAYPNNHGKGHALRKGMAEVQEPYCLFTDIDFPYQEHSMAAVYRLLVQSGADIVVGVRDDAYYAQVPPARRRVSKLLRRVTRHVLRLPVEDTQCGLKGFNTTGRQLFLRTTTQRYLFDLELLLLASRLKHLRVVPQVVELKPGIIFSRLNPRILLTETTNLIRILGRRRRD